MNIEDLHRIHLIGIGGIGMSALARHFHKLGITVSGYDRTRSDITDSLTALGITIHYEENPGLIPKDPELVIYTPAIPIENIELAYFKSNNYPVFKRSDALEWITRGKFTIAVSGTHGKTTVSTMIAHVLKAAGINCTAFLGGISTNYKSNYIPGDDRVMVVEADEYDRSFLKLQPDIGVITAIDLDHLDIYGNYESVQEAYSQFVSKIKKNGILIHKQGLEIRAKADKILSYSISGEADYRAREITVQNGAFNYKFDTPQEQGISSSLSFPGFHNVENAMAAIGVASEMDIPAGIISGALSSFQGINRRIEYIIKSNETVYIDDYAHHPSEIHAVIKSVRELYPERKMTVLFQPHLYSRTRDFASGFAKALSMADEVIITDIYPARELPIPGITGKIIFDDLQIPQRHYVSKSDILDTVKRLKPSLLLTLGAGDIDRMVDPIKQILLK